MSESVSVTREVSASPERVYELVADLPRMGEWSPENQGGEWLGGAGAATPGARFRGRNRHGRRQWHTVSTVVAAEPGRRLEWEAGVGPVKVSRWTYTLEPAPSGCRVTESWADLRPGWFRPIAGIVTGVRDRTTHNRQGMEQTLARLAAAAGGDPA